jgi:hypothetical protein
MSKTKSPRQKKKLAYERDHRYIAEYPHGFRKSWPRKKAKAERAARHGAKQLLNATGDDTVLADIHRRTVKKWGGAATLREMVAAKQAKRAAMVGARKRRTAQRKGNGAAPDK